MVKSLLIKNGLLVTAVDKYEADVYTEGEQIHTIGKNLNFNADEIIDAKNCYLFPGGIDPHTHMELPFMGTCASDTFETGTIAGLYGGTTTIIDFAIQTQGKSLKSAIDEWHRKADGNAVCDYAFHMGVTDFNKNTQKEIKEICEKDGISSFKIFMAYKGALMIDDRQIIGLMKEAGKYGGMVISHCENGDMIDELVSEAKLKGNLSPVYHYLTRPEIAEAEATGRIIDMAYQGSHPLYIVHMTCEAALNRVREATKRNQKVNAETCIQYLLLDESLYESPGFEGAKWIMSPPLRKEKDRAALWSGIAQNLVHTVATDHCPFCMDQKRMGISDFSKIPNGIPGIEHRLELLFSEGVLKEKISLNKFVELTSTQAAKIFGMFPKKGTIAAGADADIVIFDPNIKHTLSAKTHHHKCDYSAFEGWQVQGKCKTVILRGTIAIDNAQALIKKGFGKYIKRSQYNKEYKKEKELTGAIS
ncbi:MAG: dihydropyrimidinase [Candidatus Melainabacteria bacterium RIFCSPLOWO2_02_FULL_35_15]|nr:MAG: dihydropyrimidinase [Candidatus Melainabacteria bacterium RIFCSPLOWO2_12_FULL_35_11]OGI14030.1 MAG: dihydropyrimidinase [Candidatus Melainabacteria bacterium RIFCSPLOWO2_02_FULL_35_15]